MDERLRFVRDAQSDRYDMSELCARYGVSRRVGSVWLARYEAEGRPGLVDRSHAPHHSPTRFPRRWPTASSSSGSRIRSGAPGSCWRRWPVAIRASRVGPHPARWRTSWLHQRAALPTGRLRNRLRRPRRRPHGTDANAFFAFSLSGFAALAARNSAFARFGCPAFSCARPRL